MPISCSTAAKHEAQYIYLDCKLLASHMYWYICFLPDFSGAEIKFNVQCVCVVVPKWPI